MISLQRSEALYENNAVFLLKIVGYYRYENGTHTYLKGLEHLARVSFDSEELRLFDQNS